VSTPTRTGIPAGRWPIFLLAALAAVLAFVLPAGTASASSLPTAGTRVGVFLPATPDLVGVAQHITAGQHWVRGPSQLRLASGHCVAAEDGVGALSGATQANVDNAIERAAAGKVRFTGHDGKPYLNSDGLLPEGEYTEWTAAEAGAKRGADRVIIEGDPANPSAIYYWDHVNPPVRIR